MERDLGPFLRQLSGSVREGEMDSSSACNSRGSRRWGRGAGRSVMRRMEEEGGGGSGVAAKRKRVMVVVDESARAKHAMMWALTHVATKGDLLTLLHVVPSHYHVGNGGDTSQLASSLGSFCKACKPEVEVEAVVIQGPKLATVLGQVRKLEVNVLVLSQGKPSLLCCLLKSDSEELVEQCINQAECLTLAVKKRSKGLGGYLVNSRWHKNFWLLA